MNNNTSLRLTSRDAVIEAAFLEFNDNPRASLADIAQRAGVGRATLHRHFGGRSELISAMSGQAKKELAAAVDAATSGAESHTEGLRLALAAIIPLANRHWFLANEHSDVSTDQSAETKRERMELLREIDLAKSEGTFEPEMPTVWIAETYENLIYGAWSMVREGELTHKQAAKLAWQTLMAGTGRNKE